MQTYQSTPDYYNDYISHYGTQAKTHKYIDRKKGKNGKWIYIYDNSTQKSAYSDRKDQIKTTRRETDSASFWRKHKQEEARKYAYPDRARQIKEARERAKSKYSHRRYKGTDYYNWRSRMEGWKDDSSKQSKILAKRSGATRGNDVDSDKEVGRRLMYARVNANKKYRARKSVESTTKGYGKYSTRPSKKALETRSRNKKAAQRARENRKAK